MQIEPRRILCVLAFVALALAVARPVGAREDESTAKARVHLRAGIADYDEGRYAEAEGKKLDPIVQEKASSCSSRRASSSMGVC